MDKDLSLNSPAAIEPDGLKGEITEKRRPLKGGEQFEWILLNGVSVFAKFMIAQLTSRCRRRRLAPTLVCTTSTPERSTSSSLVQIVCLAAPLGHQPSSRFPRIDGKNASTAFGLSSGTIGAALAASLSSFPSIALSYGVVSRPVPPRAVELAHDISARIVERLWADWGNDAGDRYHYRHEMEDVAAGAVARADAPPEGVRGGKMDMRGKVALYSVNVPLITEKLEEGRRKIWWTRMWRNGYGQLFKEKLVCVREASELSPALTWRETTARRRKQLLTQHPPTPPTRPPNSRVPRHPKRALGLQHSPPVAARPRRRSRPTLQSGSIHGETLRRTRRTAMRCGTTSSRR